MIRKVDIYIETSANNYSKLELFNDEKISITLSVQNIQDISKVYTDYSQSFTVPATPINNRIFEHFYESAVDGTIDHNKRRLAFIEVELTPFRSGKIQLEKANMKHNRVESYTITFYGDLVTLKDKFGTDKLKDLDYTTINHTYTGAEVQSRITTTTDTYNVRYPLISSERIWVITGGGSQDITSTGHHMNYTELFPAVRVKSLFDLIATKYSVTFTGNFLSDDRFKKLFLWYKNSDVNTTWSQPLDLTFESFVDRDPNAYINGDSISIKQPSTVKKTDIVAYISSATGIRFKIEVYKNYGLLSTHEYDGTVGGYFTIYSSKAVDNSFQTYSFKLISENPLTIRPAIQVYRQGTSYGLSLDVRCDSLTTTNVTDLSLKAPDMTIADFFSGILKEFNLTCYATAVNSFRIEPLDDWYSQGAVIDVTKHVDIDNIEIGRPQLYKSISFEYEKSESFLNVAFANANNLRGYGDTSLKYEYDGQELIIKQPFENLLHTKFTSTNFQVAYALDKSYNKYIPKPCLLYMYDSQSCSFKFDNNTTVATITNYMPFGQEVASNGQVFTSNFSADAGTLTGEQNNTLFATYYFSYLANLFNLKNRLTTVRMILPISLVTSIKLNDRVIIRDKRYIINNITTDITTGEVNAVLLNDFRPIMNAPQLLIASGGGTYQYPVDIPNGETSVALSSTTSGVTLTPSSVTASGYVSLYVPANPTSLDVRITEDSDVRISEDGSQRITESYTSGLIDITHTYSSGSETIYLIQE